MSYMGGGIDGKRIFGYSVMALTIATFVLLFFGYVVFNYFSNTVNTINNTLVTAGGQIINNASNSLHQVFKVNYTDPFTSTILTYLNPVARFLYAIVTNPKLFFTIVAVDIILMAFDVYWLEENEE